MKNKFKDFAATPKNSNWLKLIERENELYGRPDDIRSQFARDYTRIIHSLAYRRLKHKTQVFFNAAGNDHICTRMEHVLHVDSVSSTIASFLGLNEELTKAIAMGHDLGHAPFGHEGERALAEIAKNNLGEDFKFWHEENGLYFADNIELLEDYESNLQNLNLTYAVRDGIISHCGEVDENGLKPREELFDLSKFKNPGQTNAATWEGCVVKVADKIAYLGRDIEDAMRLDYFDEKQKQKLRDLAKLTKNSTINTTVIMHSMILDLCKNSDPVKGLTMSDEAYSQLVQIKNFNYENIYFNKRLEPYKKYSELILGQIFEVLSSYYRGSDTLEYLYENNFDKRKFVKDFVLWIMQYCDMEFSEGLKKQKTNLSQKNKKIYGNLDCEKVYMRAVLDYISGMTDNYAYDAFNELLGC